MPGTAAYSGTKAAVERISAALAAPAVAMTMALIAGRGSPRATAALLVPATVVAFSRMYVGAHLPLDVAGGFAVGVVVDTHVGRISKKLGLTDQKDPVKIERQLNECLPQKEWRDFGHLLIDHGRKTCRARAPRCDECPIYKWCEVRA